jgi:hypothetical protein
MAERRYQLGYQRASGGKGILRLDEKIIKMKR